MLGGMRYLKTALAAASRREREHYAHDLIPTEMVPTRVGDDLGIFQRRRQLMLNRPVDGPRHLLRLGCLFGGDEAEQDGGFEAPRLEGAMLGLVVLDDGPQLRRERGDLLLRAVQHDVGELGHAAHPATSLRHQVRAVRTFAAFAAARAFGARRCSASAFAATRSVFAARTSATRSVISGPRPAGVVPPAAPAAPAGPRRAGVAPRRGRPSGARRLRRRAGGNAKLGHRLEDNRARWRRRNPRRGRRKRRRHRLLRRRRQRDRTARRTARTHVARSVMATTFRRPCPLLQPQRQRRRLLGAKQGARRRRVVRRLRPSHPNLRLRELQLPKRVVPTSDSLDQTT